MMQKQIFFILHLTALPVFKATVAKEDRSKMNAVFVMQDTSDLEKEFLDAV